MPEDRDYDYVFGKLPRKDKDGKDTKLLSYNCNAIYHK